MTRTFAHRADEPRWRGRWMLYAAGAGFIAFGLRTLLGDTVRTPTLGFTKFFVGFAVVHDAVIAPLVALIGVVLIRLVPRWARSTVQGALIVIASVALIAAPMVAGFGRRADDPSALPQNYGRNLGIVVALIVAVAAGLLVLRSRSHERAAKAPSGGRDPEG